MGQRAERVGDLIFRELSRVLRERISDPRLADATITGVDLSDDLKAARVYFSVLDAQPRRIEAEHRLAGQRGPHGAR